MVASTQHHALQDALAPGGANPSTAGLWIRGGLAALVVLIAPALATSLSASETPPFAFDAVTVQVGAFNVGREPVRSGAGLEIRDSTWSRSLSRSDRLRLSPVVGFGGSAGQAAFGYTGVRADLALPHRWRMSGGFAVALYSGYGNIDLGGPIEFRSSFVLAHRLANGLEVGATFFHLSNGRLYRKNPGTNELALLLELPLRSHGRGSDRH